MADNVPAGTAGDPAGDTGAQDATGGSVGDAPGKKLGMSEAEIRTAGLAVDVPFETPGPQLERLQYADLGDGKRWTPPEGWPPAEGQPTATEDANVKDSGSGA